MTSEELLDAARVVAENAYAPYSGFRVGAIIVANDGTTYQGVNWENAAYPSGTCAEASAISAAVTAGSTALETVAVACIDAGADKESFPCGQCRQRLYEFGVKNVIVAKPDGSAEQYPLEDLLPHGFRFSDT